MTAQAPKPAWYSCASKVRRRIEQQRLVHSRLHGLKESTTAGDCCRAGKASGLRRPWRSNRKNHQPSPRLLCRNLPGRISRDAAVNRAHTLQRCLYSRPGHRHKIAHPSQRPPIRADRRCRRGYVQHTMEDSGKHLLNSLLVWHPQSLELPRAMYAVPFSFPSRPACRLHQSRRRRWHTGA